MSDVIRCCRLPTPWVIGSILTAVVMATAASELRAEPLTSSGIAVIDPADNFSAAAPRAPNARNDPDATDSGIDLDTVIGETGDETAPEAPEEFDAPSLIPTAIGAGIGIPIAAAQVSFIGASALYFYRGAQPNDRMVQIPPEFMVSLLLYVAATPFALLALVTGPALYFARVFFADDARRWEKAGAWWALVPAALSLGLLAGAPAPWIALSFVSPWVGIGASAVMVGASAVSAVAVPVVALAGDYLVAIRNDDDE